MDRDPRTDAILAAAFHVHSRLGPGMLESAYEACLAHTLARRGHKVARQVGVAVTFDDLVLETGYRMDLVVDDAVVLEVKAVEQIRDVHTAQLLTYLRFSGLRVGLVLNFNTAHLRDGIVRRVR